MKKKSLILNAIYNVAYKTLNIMFPLMMTMYASRVLTVYGMGKIASAQNIASYFVVLSSLGIPYYGVKAIASVRDNKRELNSTFSELFILNGLSTLLSGLAYIMMLITVSYFKSSTLLYLVVGINIFFNILNVDWFYQGIEEYKYIMLRNICVKIICCITTILLVHSEEDYIIYALLSSLALCLNYFFNVFYLTRFIKITFAKANIGRHFRPIILLLFSTIAIEIYTLVDTTMLTFMYGEVEVGLYSNASKVIRAVRGIMAAVCAVFLPKLSYLYSLNKKNQVEILINKGFSILILLTLPTVIGIIMIANPLIIIMFGDSFQGSIFVTQILSVSVLSVALSSFFGNQVLITYGKEKIVMISTMLGAIANIVINLLLINMWGIIGAAIASVLTECVVAIFQGIYVSAKISKINVDNNFFKSILFSCGFMIFAIWIIKYIITNIHVQILLAVLIGGLVYFSSLYICKNTLILELKSSILNKVCGNK